jgi:transposase-like protein
MEQSTPKRLFSNEEKVKIIREHLVEKVALSQICEKYQLQPSTFYGWQKTFFENGTAAFGKQPSHSRVSLEQKKITQLEAKLQRKDEVLAELLTEHIILKKTLGET